MVSSCYFSSIELERVPLGTYLRIDEIVDWDEYFSKQKQTYMDAIEQLETELPHV